MCYYLTMSNIRPVTMDIITDESSLTSVPYSRESSRMCKKLPPDPKNSWLKDISLKSAQKREHELYKAPVEMPVEETVELAFDTQEE